MRRSVEQIAADRRQIVESVRAQHDSGKYQVRVQKDWRAGDIAALVASGQLARHVEKEWDRQPGNGAMFGGAGVCVRYRAYVALPELAPSWWEK